MPDSDKGEIGSRIRILIAEDHALVREGTARLLSQYPDFEIVGKAEDGMKALQLVEALKPDVLIADIRMPGLNAIEMMGRLTRSNSATKVIILTAYEDEEYVVSLLRLGVSGYLLKTVDLLELVESIRVVHLGQIVIDPAVSGKIARGLSSANARPARSGHLTKREEDVLRLAAEGKDNRQIAEEMSLSIRTVEGHLGHIYTKLSVTSREEAVRAFRSPAP